jgi:gliding motility-associated-like protein
MRYIITLVLLITHLSIFSQNCSLVRFQVRPDSNALDKVDTTVCRGTCLDLYASVPSLRATTSYSVSSIPYLASLPCETGGVASSWGATADDYASPIFPIGFNFCFYGNTYSNFVISPNGFMTFTSSFADLYSSYDAVTLPLVYSVQRPPNCIYGAWMDIDVSQTYSTGTITYETVGSAPFRALIVKWINCSYFGASCASSKLNMKIVLYETSNIIDVYIGSKPAPNPVCPNYVKVSTQGLQGNNGTEFVVTPGRNATIWPTSNNAVRFSPSGINYPYTVTWFKNSTNIGTTNKLSICPTEDSSIYRATAVINSPCPVTIVNVTDSVKVRTRPSSFNIVNKFDTLNCLNTKTLDALSGYSYNWLNVNNKTRYRTITDSGKYSIVKIVDTINCLNDTMNFFIAKRAPIKIDSTIFSGCFNSSLTGKVNINTKNGIAPILYGKSLSKLGYNSLLDSIPFGTSKVYVKDTNFCIDSATFTRDSIILNNRKYNLSCFNDATGKIKLLGTGGTSPYQFKLSTTSYAAIDSFSGLSAGTIIATIKDNIACEVQSNIILTQPTKLSATYLVDSASCFNGSNGKITITTSGGTPGYNFSLNGFAPVTSNIFNSLNANTYNIKIRDINNCLIDTNLVLSQNPQLGLNALIDSITCNRIANGKVTLLASGGKGPYTFSKDNITFGSSNVFNALDTGKYTFLVRDSKNCTNSISLTLFDPSKLTLNTSIIRNVSCFGQSTGAAKVVASQAKSPYTYLWSNGSTLDSAIGMNFGSKKVVITDAKGCKDSTSTTITQPDSLHFTSVSTLTKCFGDSTGKIKLTGIGGVSPYQYNRDAGIFASIDSFTNLWANNFNIGIKDANGCLFTKSVSVSQPTKLTATYEVDSVSCFGGSSGKITITSSGGTPNYRYSLNGATSVSSNIFSNLLANTYNVKLRDTNNCLVDTNLVVSQYPVLGLNALIDSITCNRIANGKVTLLASGGKSTYTFSKDNITFVASNIFNGLDTGSYIFRVRDAKNCTNSISLTLFEPTKLVLNASVVRNVLCYGNSTGSAKVIATQATSPYSYLWVNGSTLDSAIGMNAGSKKVVVTDAKGCKDSISTTITQPDSLHFTSVSTLTKCFGDSTGSIKLTGFGGETPYAFQLETNAFTSIDSFVGLPAKSYSISIKDNNNCLFSKLVNVSQPTLLTKTTVIDSVKCFNGNSGKITINGLGGTTPYTFSLQNASYISSNIYGSLTAGNYSVSIKDANNCKSDTNVVVAQYSQIQAAITNTDIVCNNNNIGKIDVVGSGGNPSYTYSLDSITFKTGTNFSNLAAGIYSVFVKDANNCVRKWQDTIKQTFDVNNIFNKKDVNCFGFSDGNFTVKGTGGVSPYTYSFQNGAFASTDSFSNLVAANYNVITLDQVGCRDTIVVSIVQPSALAYSSQVDSVKCFGQNTGKITVNASGGTTPYTYIMDGTISQSSNIFPNLISDTFAIRVRDAKLCVKDTQIILNTYPDIKFSYTLDSVKCFNALDGSTTVSVLGGLAPYQYKLDAASYQNSNIISNIGYGAHTVIIKDVYNCQKSFSFSYTNPTKLITTLLSQTNILCNGDTTGFVAVSSSGGRLPHSYLWNNGSTNDTLPKVIAGLYSLTTTDAKGCNEIIQTTVTQPQALSFTWSNANLTCFRDTTGLASIRVSGGVSPYKYLWNTGDSVSLISKLLAGNYTVTVTDKNGCKKTETQILTEPAIISFTIDKVNSSCLESKNGSLTVNNIKGGTAPYNLKWEDNSFNNTLSNIQAFKNYSVQVFDVNSCVTKDLAKVDTNYRLRVNPRFVEPKCPDSKTDVILIPENGVATYTYKLNNVTNNTGLFNTLPNGLYLFETKDGAGCMYKDTADLILKDSMRPTLINYDPDCQTANVWPSKLNVIGGAQPYVFSWSGAFFTNTSGDSAIHNKRGSYSVSVKDNNNCSLSYNFELKPADGAIDVELDSLYNLRCFGVPEGKAVISVKGGAYPYKYLWSHGDKDSIGSEMFANVKYTVSVSDDSGCRYILDDIYLTEPTRIQAKYASRNETCPNLTDAYILVNPYNGTATNSQSYWIKLNDGPFTKDHRYSFLTKGTYKVTIRDENECEVDTTFTITAPPEIKLSLDAVYEVEAGSSVDMFPNIQIIGGSYSSLNYLWTPNESLKCADCINNTFYGAKNTDLEFSIKFGENCEVKANTTIKIKGLDGELIYIPNVFNPNDTREANQTFKIFGSKIKRYNLKIFNRWGEKVFDSHTQENAWNGMFRGEYVQPGEYIYLAEVEMLDGQILKRKGTFAFIR